MSRAKIVVLLSVAASASVAVCTAVWLLAGVGNHPELVGPQGETPQSITLSIVGTADLHGGILPREGRGGLALLAGYVNNLRAARARDGGAVLLLDAGDMFQGTLESNFSEGASVVAAYNVLGYSAAAIGNHEFDFGPVGPAATPRSPADDPTGALKMRAAEAKFPFLAANLLDQATGRPVSWPNVKPSAIVDAAGIKVGVIGVMTKNALTATIAANTRGLGVAPLAATIGTHAAQLRSQGATVVIVAAHAGGSCTAFDQPGDLSSCQPSSEIMDVARELPRALVDAIVAGHTHAAMAHDVDGIAITQAFSGGRAFGRVDLTVDRTTGRVTGRRIFPPRDLCAHEDPATHGCADVASAAKGLVEPQYEGIAVAPDPKIADVLVPALERVRALKAGAVGVFLETPMRRMAGVDSPLGNLFTDAMLDSVTGSDLAINNTEGGIRADLPQGPLLYGSLFEAFPFDNLLVSLRLSGAELRQMFATALQQRARLFGVSGIRVRAQCSAGALAVTLLRDRGGAIRDDERVVVATTDFLALGGGGIFAPVIPPGGFPIAADAPLVRDSVAEWLRRRGGRMREEELVNVDNPRWVFPGALPVDCKGR